MSGDNEVERSCPTCGEESPPRFRFCGWCGTQFTDIAPTTEVRKTVTVVFSDLKGSTTLGDSLDPEALREVIARYFAEMRAAVEGHGGSVEKYIGDAVMAVFGIPHIHEDDPLRAVRCAAEMKQRLAELNVELERHWGVRLINRTGVNTGEIVAGKPVAGQRLVIGDAVNVAARLEQAAPETEILIGDPTYRLVRDSVEVEEMEPLELKGKPEPVPAYRLLAVREQESIGHEHERPMVGREEEMGALRDAFAEAISTGTPRLATVLAEAGMGKTRMVRELSSSLTGSARLVEGRCLPYGEGITFWPLLEIFQRAAGIGEDDPPDLARSKLRTLAGGENEMAVERVAAAIGLSDQQFPIEETFRGVREMVEALTREVPLVVVCEDIHWAEPTLLDLIDHLADSARGSILFLCMARPELLERRPEWQSRHAERLIQLKPLGVAEMSQLLDHALGKGALTGSTSERILTAADGNPLYVEQMLSMLIDDGVLRFSDGRWEASERIEEVTVPPTIQALLAARLDSLDRDERAVIEPAAVIGQIFPEDAVRSLVHDTLQPETAKYLQSVSRKQLIHRDASGPFAEQAFRFQHILVRDAVYGGLLKRTRAELHERFAEWSEQTSRARGRETEFAEILGYHLEQAHLNLAELGPLDEHGRRLGERAAGLLAGAGRRAFARGDMSAAANTLGRAARLLDEPHPERVELLPELAEALTEAGDFGQAAVVAAEAVERAEQSGDERLAAHGRVVQLLLQGQSGGEGDADSAAESALEALAEVVAVFDRTGDRVGLASAHRLAAWAQGTECHYGDAAKSAFLAVHHASDGGDERQRRRAASAYSIAAVHGPTPVTEGIGHLRDVLSWAEGDRRTEGVVMGLLARLEAMSGEIEAAREHSRQAAAALADLGHTVIAASSSIDSSAVELLGGDPDAAVAQLRSDYATLEEMGERYLLSTVTSELARALLEAGDEAGAEAMALRAAELADPDDLAAQSLWRWVRARVLAGRDEIDEAERLATEAVALLDGTDALVARAEALVASAEIALTASKPDAAARLTEEALDLYRAKGDVVSEQRTAGRLAIANT